MNRTTIWHIVLISLAVLQTISPTCAQKVPAARKYVEAWDALNSGHLTQAEQFFKVGIKADEENRESVYTNSGPYFGLLITYQKAKRFEDALQVSDQYIALLKAYQGEKSLEMMRALKYKEQLL